MSVSLVMLHNYHILGKHKYSPFEMLADAAMGALFLSVYIAGIVILARNRYWNITFARGIPLIYSNLSCLVML